jgi:hypothetical protein
MTNRVDVESIGRLSLECDRSARGSRRAIGRERIPAREK